VRQGGKGGGCRRKSKGVTRGGKRGRVEGGWGGWRKADKAEEGAEKNGSEVSGVGGRRRGE